MRVTTLVSLLIAIAIFAPAASAATVEWTITGHNEDGEYWFEVDGMTGKNPTLNAQAGDDVKILFKNVGTQVHNVAFASPISKKTEIIAGGENRTLEFKISEGASGDVEYFCEPHIALGMKGTLKVQAKEGASAPEEKATPGFPAAFVALGLVGVALALRRRS